MPPSCSPILLSLSHQNDDAELFGPMRAPIGSGSSPLVLDQSLHFYSPNGHLKVLFYTFVNKTIYIFITQALSLPVALESIYKAPSVTLTYWCEQKRSTGLPLKEESKPPRDLKNQNLEKLCVGITVN